MGAEEAGAEEAPLLSSLPLGGGLEGEGEAGAGFLLSSSPALLARA